MNSHTGDLLAVYEWSLQIRQARNKGGDTKRLKQVPIHLYFELYESTKNEFINSTDVLEGLGVGSV